ncbi:LCP family protein [Barrientosiimonas marina]|uniref:LCP family protein n=1 Tax=Lentibacillus kimchii TaxID=1542911 RepID=A0ABW2UUT1_9BACI
MSDETRRGLYKRRKRKLRKRVIFILIPVILLLAVAVYATYIYVKADSTFSESHVDDGKEKSDLREQAVDPTEDNVSILIAGVDNNDLRYHNSNPLTDTLMLATLNKDKQSVKMLSIPRDSLVYIPEAGQKRKINSAHAIGGMEATRDTVENLLDIPVDYYVKLNFKAFIDVVNAVNGITVDVPYEFKEQDSEGNANAVHLYPGEQKLNGEEALAFARTRKKDNDIERGKRQQEVIKAVVDKSVSIKSILKIDNIIDAVGSNMTTNMKFGEMKSFISYGMAGKDLDFDTYTLQGSDYWPGDAYYWKVDQTELEKTKRMLKQHLELETDMSSPGNNSSTSSSSNGEQAPNSTGNSNGGEQSPASGGAANSSGSAY